MDKLLLFLLVTAIGSTLASRYTRLGEFISKSSMKMLKASFESSQDSLVISPLSIMMLLAAYNLGAGPMAGRAITSLLGGAHPAHTTRIYKDLMDTLSRHSPELLAIANKVYVSHNYRLNNTFVAESRIFHSDTETADFSQRELTANMINRWADEHTGGVLGFSMNSDDLDPRMSAMLVNAVYFKGNWQLPFSNVNTEFNDFYYNKYSAMKIPMMHVGSFFRPVDDIKYTECPELDAKMVVLPYKEPGFRMVIVLPDEVDGLSNMLNKIEYYDVLSYVYNAKSEKIVIVRMPKFTMMNRLDFDEVLVKAGAGAIFEEPAPGIVVNSAVPASKIYQYAFIEINEEDTTGGTYAGEARRQEWDYSKIFTANHPFMYLILYKDKIIFAGIFKH